MRYTFHKNIFKIYPRKSIGSYQPEFLTIRAHYYYYFESRNAYYTQKWYTIFVLWQPLQSLVLHKLLLVWLSMFLAGNGFEMLYLVEDCQRILILRQSKTTTFLLYFAILVVLMVHLAVIHQVFYLCTWFVFQRDRRILSTLGWIWSWFEPTSRIHVSETSSPTPLTEWVCWI